MYDYVAGKVDWLAFGLAREGTAADEPRVGDAAVREVPTALLHERLAVVRERAARQGWETCVVINEERVVLGLLGRSALRGPDAGAVEQAMTEGPSTVRPNKPLLAELERMVKHNLTSVVVTTPDGRLHGVLRRADAEARA